MVPIGGAQVTEIDCAISAYRRECVEGPRSRTGAEARTANVVVLLPQSALAPVGGNRLHDGRSLDERRVGDLLRFSRHGIDDKESNLWWHHTES